MSKKNKDKKEKKALKAVRAVTKAVSKAVKTKEPVAPKKMGSKSKSLPVTKRRAPGEAIEPNLPSRREGWTSAVSPSVGRTHFLYITQHADLSRFTMENRASWPTYAQGTDRVITLATRINGDQNILEYQMAVCHPSKVQLMGGYAVNKGDRFSRDIGRKIATGRLASDPHAFKLSDETLRGGHQAILLAVLKDAVSNKNVSGAAKKVLVEELSWRESEFEMYGRGSVEVAPDFT